MPGDHDSVLAERFGIGIGCARQTSAHTHTPKAQHKARKHKAQGTQTITHNYTIKQGTQAPGTQAPGTQAPARKHKARKHPARKHNHTQSHTITHDQTRHASTRHASTRHASTRTHMIVIQIPVVVYSCAHQLIISSSPSIVHSRRT